MQPSAPPSGTKQREPFTHSFTPNYETEIVQLLPFTLTKLEPDDGNLMGKRREKGEKEGTGDGGEEKVLRGRGRGREESYLNILVMS